MEVEVSIVVYILVRVLFKGQVDIEFYRMFVIQVCIFIVGFYNIWAVIGNYFIFCFCKNMCYVNGFFVIRMVWFSVGRVKNGYIGLYFVQGFKFIYKFGDDFEYCLGIFFFYCVALLLYFVFFYLIIGYRLFFYLGQLVFFLCLNN